MRRPLIALLSLLSCCVLPAGAAERDHAPDRPATPAVTAAPAALLALLPDGVADATATCGAPGAVTACEIGGDLPTRHPCATQRYPLHVRIHLRIFADPRAFDLTAAAAMEQALAGKREEFDRLMRVIEQNATTLLRVGPLRTLPGPDGTVLVLDDLVDCSGGRHLEHPDVWLYAAVRNDHVLLTLDLDGVATAEEARLVARGILDRFARTTSFTAGDPGPGGRP